MWALAPEGLAVSP